MKKITKQMNQWIINLYNSNKIFKILQKSVDFFENWYIVYLQQRQMYAVEEQREEL